MTATVVMTSAALIKKKHFDQSSRLFESCKGWNMISSLRVLHSAVALSFFWTAAWLDISVVWTVVAFALL